MRSFIVILAFIVAPIFSFGQSQQGFIYVIDETADGLVFYITPLLECSFPGDHDGIDAMRKKIDEQYTTFVNENYEIENYDRTHNDWMTAGRGVNPERSYQQELENIPVMNEGATVIVVEGFMPGCP